MDFKDWRKPSTDTSADPETPKTNKYRGRQYRDYIEEQIRDAQARGEFDNLPGFGKPLNLDSNPYLGDRAMGYNLLKSSSYAPKEIEHYAYLHDFSLAGHLVREGLNALWEGFYRGRG